MKIPAKVANKAKHISVLLMDVDGTLTDGSVTLLSQSDGSALELKNFDAHDGQGLTLAVTAGLRTGVITGRASPALRRRCKELDIELVYEKQGQKIAPYCNGSASPPGNANLRLEWGFSPSLAA